MNVASWLAQTAQISGGRTAFYVGTDPVLDYAGFDRAARAFAGWLTVQGIAPGDRVALFMKNVPEYLIAQYGAWYAGAAVVPINAKLHPRETDWICHDAEASMAVVTPDLAEGLPGTGLLVVGSESWQQALSSAPVDVPVHRGPDDLAWLFYTSGTTGRPKGVIITHQMLLTVSLGYAWDVDTVAAQDHTIYAAPLSHGAGLYNLIHVRAGAGHAFPKSGGFNPIEVLDLARALGRAHLFMAPTMVQRLTRAAKTGGYKGTGLRTIVYAGGPMYNADIIEAVERFGPVFVQIYGQGECPMGITALSRADVVERNRRGWLDRLGSVGRAQSAVEVRIADAAGRTVPRGEVGEIVVRGPSVMPGYWRNPEATAKTLKDGWLLTGDMGSMDAEGYVTLKDRSKDMIVSGGSNIYPREVEEVLLSHSDVAEVSVVGQPDPEWGEVVVAFVVPREGVTLDQVSLDALCLSRIARFKRPKRYVTVTNLPKNNYGKVLKTALRDALSDGVDS